MAFTQGGDDPSTPESYNLLGQVFWKRYKEGHRADDLDKAISSYDRSVRMTPDFDPEQGVRLSDLGIALRSRFQDKRELSDIDMACFCLSGSLLSEPRGARARLQIGNLGGAFLERATWTGNNADLAQAITFLHQVVDLTPGGDPDKSRYLNNLGNAFETRFDRIGDVSDLEMAISLKQKAVALTPDGHADKPSCLTNLGNAFETRFNRLGDISDMEVAFSLKHRAVDLTPDSRPEKPGYLSNLGNAFETRFHRLGDISDIEMAVSFKQNAVDLAPDGHPDKPGYLKNLGNAFEARFRSLGDVSDLEMAISVKQKAVDLTPDGHHSKPGRFNNLGNAFEARFDRIGDVSDLEMAISVKQKGVDLTPHGHPDMPNHLNHLGSAFETRFNHLGHISDLEMAVSVKQKAVDLTPDNHPSKPGRLNNLGNAFERRFHRLGEISDMEMAISVTQKAVDLTPDGHPSKPRYLNNLGNAFETRFDHIGDISDLETAISLKQKAVDLTPNGHPDKPGCLTNLGLAFKTRFDHLGDVLDLELAISVKQKAVDLTPDGHPSKHMYLNNLGLAHETRFDRLGDISDLEMAVDAMERSVDSTADGHLDKPSCLLSLARALLQRYMQNQSASDLEAAINRVSTAARSVVGLPHVQFKATLLWSKLSEMINDDQQTFHAYSRAIGLIPRLAWMGLAIEGRHQELEQVGGLVRDAAAAAVRYGDPDRALRWLEQGRSVVWGQSLQQRTPVDMLRERDPIRADRLIEISRNLESNAKDTESSAELRVKQHRSLVLEWDALVSEVRKLEGFEDFLGPKKISQLLTAASSYPIVVLNAHKAGCDALVLKAEADAVIHIPLRLNSRRARELLDTLETIKARHARGRNVEPSDRGFRVVGSESYDPGRKIESVLAEVWTSVVKPVLDALAFSLPDNDYDDLPRICWCPTGPVAFLPIHAAGLYNTDERGTKVFDFVVSSYTPTVSALLQAPSPNPTLPKIFAVAQAQQTTRGFSALPNTSKEIQLIIHRAEVNSIDLVVAEDEAGTVKRVLNEMTRCNWVHLACHGTQDLDHPTKSAFILADGDLELSEIIKHSLPHAEFAFLSACQTATGDVKLTEEAIHLAAGMMLAGYRSVIATMWSISDKDGPDVADEVYAEMLKDGKADYTRAAYALHRAVQKLRLSGAPFMAWMPFIHMGR